MGVTISGSEAISVSDKLLSRSEGGTMAPADAKAVAKRTLPSPDQPLVQMLNGADYLRVWVNHGGTQYLVHLSLAKK